VPGGIALGETMLAPVQPHTRRTTAPRLAMTTASAGQIVGTVTSAPAPAKRRWLVPAVIAGVAAAGAVGFVATRGSEAPKAAATAPAPAPAPTPAPPPSPAPDPTRTVEVTIAPADAVIEVDGATATAHDGTLELKGTVGSVHHVTVEHAGRSTAVDVVIAETGAVPAKVELPPPPIDATTRPPPHKHSTKSPPAHTKKTTPSIDRSFD
jgi:hypothetical protein